MSAMSRGYHLITDEVVNQLEGLKQVKAGLLHMYPSHIKMMDSAY